jgi:Uma2 family endonuclease
MDALLDRPMSLEAFLEWERRQELRYEFDGVRPVAMNGGTLIHSLIVTQAVIVLRAKLERTGCTVFGTSVKVVVDGRVRYPDVVVTRSAFDPSSDIVPDPVLMIEVLSPSTADIDRVDKSAEYGATASVQHYVILEQARPLATIYSRTGHGWTSDTVPGEEVLRLTALGVDVPLSEIYGGLILAEAAG